MTKCKSKQPSLPAVVSQDFGQGVASVSRCDLKRNLLTSGCSDTALEFPTSRLQVKEDRPLSDKAAGATVDATQIQPQRLHITLRPGGGPLRLGSSTFTVIHLADTFIQSEFQERALQKCIGLNN